MCKSVIILCGLDLLVLATLASGLALAIIGVMRAKVPSPIGNRSLLLTVQVSA